MGAGRTPEPASVLEAVDAHREYWRPSEVRVLLLAESHVMTTAVEAMATVSLAPYRGRGYPVFVRPIGVLPGVRRVGSGDTDSR